MTLALKGTHGTHKDNKDSIFNNGFIGTAGRKGTGSYFWCAMHDLNESAKLAWYFVKATKNSIEDSNILVLTCDIEVVSTSYLDLEDGTIKEMANAYFARKIAALSGSKNRDSNKDISSKLTDSFITFFEEVRGLSVDVVRTVTETPRQYNETIYDQRLYKVAKNIGLDKKSCYVVRNDSCIKQDSIKEVNIA